MTLWPASGPHSIYSRMSGGKIFVLTISDRCHAGTQEDVSGEVACQALSSLRQGATFLRKTVPDEIEDIKKCLLSCLVEQPVLIVTSGGTGTSLCESRSDY